MSLLSGSSLNLQISLVGRMAAAGALGNIEEPLNLSILEQLTGGTGSGQIDTVYAQAVSLAASGSETLALTGGGLTDPFGNPVAFGHVKALLLTCAAGGGGLIFGAPASNGAQLMFGALTHTAAVNPGESWLATNGNGADAQVGWPIVASTGMNIKLANASSSLGATGTLLILGTST